MLIAAALMLVIPSILSQPALRPITGRNVNPTLSAVPLAALITDTLSLPFFDDFTESSGFPSPRRWTDKQVWVNNNFPVNQPNYNVATFDHLNSKGAPYTVLNINDMTYADSLTSQPIKLDFYKIGSNTFNYLPTDSIILSFFFEMKGLGDSPESGDSLILFFKTNANRWVRVWNQTGNNADSFALVTVPLDSFKYLHADFQFRFVNYTKATGNLNHWHLDYIRLEKYRKRTAGFDVYDIHDVGIVRPSYTMFRNYFSLPYDHYKSDVNGQKLTEHVVKVRNLNLGKTSNTAFAYDVRDQSGSLVYQVPFSSSSRNILPHSDTTEHFSMIPVLSTFTGKNPSFSITYKIDAPSFNNTPDNYNVDKNIMDNNQITVKHSYTPWYAYDDGSAEGGIGLDFTIPGINKGQLAIKFENLKDDTLRGLGIYFDRNLADVSFRSFSLRIWKSLSPVGFPDSKDQLLYEYFIDHPIYTDSINRFAYIFFDSAIPLAKGTFYVGWRQTQPYILNVGYDNNYRYNGEERGNPNILYNMLGSWEYADASVKGTPMIRPLFGEDSDYTFGVHQATIADLRVYPNPTSDMVFWKSNFSTRQVRVFAADGSLIYQAKEPGNSLSLERFKNGIYQVQVTLANGQTINRQIIKN